MVTKMKEIKNKLIKTWKENHKTELSNKKIINKIEYCQKELKMEAKKCSRCDKHLINSSHILCNGCFIVVINPIRKKCMVIL